MKRPFALLLIVVVGCSPRQSTQEAASLGQTEGEHVMLIAVDPSPDFQKQIGDEFMARVIDRYFHDRVGSQDKLVIARLSGKDQIVWEGTPLALRKQFPTAEDFHGFLVSKADPSPRVHEGLRHAMQYVLADPSVATGKAKVAVLVLSSMIDQGSGTLEEGYMNHELCELGWRNGAVGFYYVAQDQILPLRLKLQTFGVRNFRVEGATGQQPLPTFE